MSKEYIELLLKYKNQATIALAFIMCVLCFVGGRYSVHIPPKAVICEAEISNNEKLFTQIKEERKAHITELREVKDKQHTECDKRVVDELEKFKTKAPKLDCRIAKAIAPQCKKKGLWK